MLMRRFASGVSLEKTPTKSMPHTVDRAPRIWISWCALRISVNIAASSRVVITI